MGQVPGGALWARRPLRPPACAICVLAFLGLLTAADTFDHLSQQAAKARAGNRIQDATGLYRQAVKLRPSWAEGWWFLGELLYDQDKYADARDALRRLVSLDHKAGPGFALLGLCEYETKEYARALEHINAGRRLGLGEDPQARRVVLYHAVLLLTKFQQYESALQVLDRVLRAGDATPAVIEAAGLAGCTGLSCRKRCRPATRIWSNVPGGLSVPRPGTGPPTRKGTSRSCWTTIRRRPTSTTSTDRSC